VNRRDEKFGASEQPLDETEGLTLHLTLPIKQKRAKKAGSDPALTCSRPSARMEKVLAATVDFLAVLQRTSEVVHKETGALSVGREEQRSMSE
jgi:hypothetical protein